MSTMNLYHFYLLLVLCSVPWINAKVYFSLTKTSTSTENRRRLAETGLPIINSLMQMASHAKAWVQWLRKQLKALRKWCNSHPPEVKLGKCFARYFNIKIPGLRGNEKFIGDAKEPKFSKEFRSSAKTNSENSSQRRELKIEKCPGKIVSFLNAVIFWLSGRFLYYRDLIFKHDLIICLWDYSVKKFWTWVDTAPESRIRL